MCAAAINIFPLPLDKHLIDSLINATNRKTIGSFLLCSIINYLTTQNTHKRFRSLCNKKCGWVPLGGSICSVANAQWPRKCVFLSEHMPWTILTEVLKWQPKHTSSLTDDASCHFFFLEKWFNHSNEMFFGAKLNFSSLHPSYVILCFFHLLALLMTGYKGKYMKSQALVLYEECF